VIGEGGGTADAIDRWPCMADPRDTDPDDQDPRERDLERRSDAPAVSPWLIIGLIVLLGAVVYVISAMVMR
jgi:hypothetical protein